MDAGAGAPRLGARHGGGGLDVGAKGDGRLPGAAGGRHTMRIPMAFLADEANISQEGKLNVLGIFDRIAAAEFPVVHPRMVFAFRVQAEFADGGRSFPVQVTMVDEDDTLLFEANGEISPPIVPPRDFSTANPRFYLVEQSPG